MGSMNGVLVAPWGPSGRPGMLPAVADSAPPVRESVEFARIVAFTDGVFAIAITLLVLSLDVPTDLPGSELDDYLLDQWPQLFAYFLSFAVVGRFWVSHHHVFSMLEGFDRVLLALNLVYLSLIVLIPFPTELLGEYSDESVAVAAYAAVVGSAGLLSWATVRHALRHGQVGPETRNRAGLVSAGIMHSVVVFYVSIPVALVSPLAGKLVWLGLLLDTLRSRR
jgi:uncharacterized membrane protein